MSIVTDVSKSCAWAGSQTLRLAADPSETWRAASILLRGAPQLAAWVAGWAATEFPVPVLTGHALSTLDVGPVHRVTRALAAQRADAVLREALTQAHGDGYHERVVHPVQSAVRRHSVHGMLHATRRRRYATATKDIAYGPERRDHLLDVWRRPDLQPGDRAPVLLQVPGGAWAISEKRGQAVPLLSRMVELGWICITINYSRSPLTPWPAHVHDVKRAIAWVRQNIADFGGDPDFIALTGGSAGAHVGSLAALTAQDRTLQPGFEDVDTSVQAVVPYYGAYDLTNPEHMCELMLPFLERFVMRTRFEDDPELYRFASPVTHVHRDAPPFFVLHGRNDAVIPHTQATGFVEALRSAGAPVVAHAELPNAHHGFDVLATVRSQMVTDSVADFLGVTYGRHAMSHAVQHVS